MLVITMGDPHSINVAAIDELMNCTNNVKFPIVIVGSRAIFTAQSRSQRIIHNISNWQDAVIGWNFLDLGLSVATSDPLTMSSAERGKVACEALYYLKTLEDPKKLAVLTCPIDKEACAQAGYAYPGQTEFFTDLWQGRSIMILAGPRLRVGLATNHLALKNVADAIDHDLLKSKINLLESSLSHILGIKDPRIGVCALNPHASDNGLFGDEEARILSPVIESLGSNIQGPFPADTLFHFAHSGEFDGVLAMYHDQGLGPLKTVHFYDAVNITGGLKHLRVSPDHGPARDLYGSDKANYQSFKEAFKICTSYIEQ